MRLWDQSKTSRAAAERGGTLVRVLILAALALLAWIWWTNRDQPPPPRPVSPAVPSRFPPPAPTMVVHARPSNPAPSPVVAPRLPSFLVPAVPTNTTRPAPTNPPACDAKVLEAQVALARQAISSGSIDGVMGSQTRAALRAFQRKAGIPQTGQLDEATQALLVLDAPVLARYTVTTNDLDRLRPLARMWLGKSLQDRLEYESVLELVAEKSHANPKLIRRLNLELIWTNVPAGSEIQIPNAEYPPPRTKAAFVEINLEARLLQVFDEATNLLAHFPCSIAQQVDKRPVGELRVAVMALAPNYTFNPEVFPESAEARELGRKLILQPGPNNPVGTVWIGLDRPGYGIHGTPRPEEVGRTESHGCFRLANWNAEYLLQMVRVGTPVYVRP
jgi:lipoprotein-anchoring transpeptidase ErfK/SrfK